MIVCISVSPRLVSNMFIVHMKLKGDEMLKCGKQTEGWIWDLDFKEPLTNMAIFLSSLILTRFGLQEINREILF